jgi:ADP-heptose:LPS heptosyltransferase
MRKNPQEPGRILLIQLRQIGDVLMCTPAIRALRKAFPHARIDFLVEPGPAKALAGNPHVTEVILRHPKRGWIENLRTIHFVRSRRYDILIDFLANPRSAIISFLSGVPLTISYANKRRSFFYRRNINQEGNYSAAHKLSLLKALGINNGDLRPVYTTSERSRALSQRWLKKENIEPGRFISIDATHRRITRRWRRFGELADLLAKEHGVKCVFLWGPGEENYIDEIFSSCSVTHIKTPSTSLDEMAAIIENSAALVGTDSAPRHLAAALGIPTLTVIGSTIAQNWTLPEPIHRTVSLDLPCRPCNKNVCEKDDFECLEALEPDTVHNKLKLLARDAVPALRDLLKVRK